MVAPSDYILDFTYPLPLESDRIEELNKQLEELRRAKIPLALSVNIIVRQGRPFAAILEVAREVDADLIIATTHGYTGVNHLLLGSTAENVVRKAPCPVLIIPGREADGVSCTSTNYPAWN